MRELPRSNSFFTDGFQTEKKKKKRSTSSDGGAAVRTQREQPAITRIIFRSLRSSCWDLLLVTYLMPQWSTSNAFLKKKKDIFYFQFPADFLRFWESSCWNFLHFSHESVSRFDRVEVRTVCCCHEVVVSNTVVRLKLRNQTKPWKLQQTKRVRAERCVRKLLARKGPSSFQITRPIWRDAEKHYLHPFYD